MNTHTGVLLEINKTATTRDVKCRVYTYTLAVSSTWSTIGCRASRRWSQRGTWKAVTDDYLNGVDRFELVRINNEPGKHLYGKLEIPGRVAKPLVA